MPESPDSKDILTLEEASLLFQVSTKTFLKLLREEEIPARKVGREWRFSRTALLEWMASGSSRQYTAMEEATHTYFTQVAPVYDEERKSCYAGALRELLISRFPPHPTYQVADIGTGTGYLAEALAKQAHEVMAIDASEAMLAVAKKNFSQTGLSNIQFIIGDAQDLPLPDASLDMTFANLLLHHLFEPEQAIKEMYRVLKPDCIAVISDVEQHPHTWVQQEKSDIWLGFSPREILGWMQKAGFHESFVTGLGCNCRTSSRSGLTIEIPIFVAYGKKTVDQKPV
ncbi:MAG TPA: methyltransferase domain-containing protein [Bacillota bacterium]